jgi:hypothetical protein
MQSIRPSARQISQPTLKIAEQKKESAGHNINETMTIITWQIKYLPWQIVPITPLD